MVKSDYQGDKKMSVKEIRVRGEDRVVEEERKLVVSNASPLIQITLAGYLWLLPELYEVMVPATVFEETQRYRDLPDAIEIAMATRAWLKVVSVDRRERVEEIHAMGLGLGEAEAFVLYEESNADALLLTDEDAIQRARFLGLNAINLADVKKYKKCLRLKHTPLNCNELTTSHAYLFACTFLD